MLTLPDLFNVQGLTAVITGGSGHLGRAMSVALAHAGANVVILSRTTETSHAVAATLQTSGYSALGIACDVLDRSALERTLEQITSTFGPIDILVNAAGGNSPSATTTPEHTFFDLDMHAIHNVLSLNFTGTLQCCQIFGQSIAERGQGCIVNIVSMSALRPLTRIPAYSAAKAAVTNFTQWLAVYMAQEYSSQIRVNAIAPGFFLTEQNRFLLTDPSTGTMTPRGQAILDHTPSARLGVPDDLIGTLLWLVSPASAFVTGIVVPVDGGFSAYSGV